MSAELAAYTHELRWVLDQIVTLLRSYPRAGIDWRPATGAANSAAAIATHVLSTTRVYVLGLGCGQPVERDRAAEFAVVGTDAAALIMALMDLANELDTALITLPATALDHRLVPPRHLWGATTDPMCIKLIKNHPLRRTIVGPSWVLCGVYSCAPSG